MKRVLLLLVMGLTGILVIALIANADRSFAGIDGLRAVTASPPASEQDPPASGAVPVLTGVLDAIRDLPVFATPGPAAAPAASVAPPPGSAGPASTPRPQAPQIGGPAPTTPPTPPSPSQPGQPQPPAPTTPAATPPTPTQAPSATPAPALTLTTDRGASAIVSLADLVPGDLMDRTISVKNTGTLAFRYVVSASQSASTLLWTDTAQGLQLTVTSGSTVLYAGPLSALGSLAGPATVAPGATDALRYTFAFPVTASDALQGLTQDLTLVFTATQYP